MELFAVKTRIITSGDDLVELVLESMKVQGQQFEDNDILALASKIVSSTEGRLTGLESVKPSEKAEKLAKEHSLAPEFAALLIR